MALDYEESERDLYNRRQAACNAIATQKKPPEEPKPAEPPAEEKKGEKKNPKNRAGPHSRFGKNQSGLVIEKRVQRQTSKRIPRYA